MSPKDASIQLKLAKAKNLLAEVDVLVHHKFYMTAINRLYYGCFHVTKALLLTKDLIPKTHSGTVSMLHQYFVQEGAFDFDQASFFSRLMQERIEDDYNDLLKKDRRGRGHGICWACQRIRFVCRRLNSQVGGK